MTFGEVIASLAVPAAAVASAAALVWRTQRADVVALNARLDTAVAGSCTWANLYVEAT